MKTIELRIGNLVINQWGEIDKVETIGKSIIQFENGWSMEEKVKPIPLNEEWLLKLGFTKEKGMLHGLDKFKLFLPCINKPVLTYSQGSFSVSDGSFSIQVEYVHQLQNLYYALTGEELTINEI